MKRALVRYIPDAVKRERHPGHSANWQSWCVHSILVELGFEVTMLSWLDKHPRIEGAYNVVFDVGRIQQLSGAFGADTVKVQFLAGCDGEYRNAMGEQRAMEASERKGAFIPYKRWVNKPEEYYEAMDAADFVICLGNEWTRNTYPKCYRERLHMMDVVGAEL